MSIYELLILSFALALDAMLVSFSYGLIICERRLKYSFALAFAFGLFQFLMPVLGCFLTGYLYKYLENYSKWVVFLIFTILGIKFIKEIFEKGNEEKINCISYVCIFLLAIATSIDAFGAGVSLKFLSVNIIKTGILIGVTTFVLSEAGFHFGNILCKIGKKQVLVLGAVLLFYLAMKAII